MKPGDLAELVRLPAALTVPGDVFAGAAAAGWPLGWRTTALPVASTCLYWAGMALNDYADRDIDRVERPERPIPSGRVSPGQALAVATGLTAAGVGAAALAGGRRALTVAVPLAGVVWTYDLWAKQNASGPAVMAAARGLDVLLGGTGGRWRDTALPVAAVATHTAAVTGLSRGEVHGASQRAGLGAAVGTAAAAAIAAFPTRPRVNRPWSEQPRVNRPWSEQPRVNRPWSEQPRVNPPWSEQPRVNPLRPEVRQPASPITRWAGPALAATYAATVGARQLAAARRPDAQTVRVATGAGVRGVIPLQAALTARKGALAVAAGLLAAGPVAKLASKVVSPT